MYYVLYLVYMFTPFSLNVWLSLIYTISIHHNFKVLHSSSVVVFRHLVVLLNSHVIALTIAFYGNSNLKLINE